ncbi:MAG: TetR family transcriptional regulator [Nocardioides sp.]
MPSTSPRERLLTELVAYAARQGLADASLRELAAAAGTSHRMLIYRFGSAKSSSPR